MSTTSPKILRGVPGPAGEPGVLLMVPRSEALDWDLKDEVASTARYWMADRQAWWVAAPYAATAEAIVFRVHGPVRPDRPEAIPVARDGGLGAISERIRRFMRRMGNR